MTYNLKVPLSLCVFVLEVLSDCRNFQEMFFFPLFLSYINKAIIDNFKRLTRRNEQRFSNPIQEDLGEHKTVNLSISNVVEALVKRTYVDKHVDKLIRNISNLQMKLERSQTIIHTRLESIAKSLYQRMMVN